MNDCYYMQQVCNNKYILSKERLFEHEINAYYLLRRKIIIIAIHHDHNNRD